MQKIIFATGNRNKLSEISAVLGNRYALVTPADEGIEEDIPETSETIEGNASQKARYIWNKTGITCFADDTGLEVESLGGAPGVYSARYAGSDKNSDANIRKLLHELEGKENRKARFRTVISLIENGREHLFEGILEGKITTGRSGDGGFGYDPVFMPEGFSMTLAEMTLEEKNRISHRGKATGKLDRFLQELFQDTDPWKNR